MKISISQPNEQLDRVNRILSGVQGGAKKAAFHALQRAGATAKTRAAQFASAEYAISKRDFMANVSSKVTVSTGAGGVTDLSISFAGTVLPLLAFRTRYARNGQITTQVMRNGGSATLQHAFVANIFGTTGVFERVGSSRLPVEQKYGPSTAHMMQNEQVVKQMDRTIQETFDKRIEHEMLRILNGWGGR